VNEWEARVSAGLAAVRARIEKAARACGRDPTSVTLVAVSKTHPAEAIRAAYSLGVRDFGENYVQELAEKHDQLRDLGGLRWHMIGHLQTNKARVVAGVAHAVHTVDSVKLARELGRRASAAGRVVGAFVQVNVSGEASKSGCAPDEAGAVIDAVRSEAGLALRGLMTIPPASDAAEDAAPVFDALVALREKLGGGLRLPDLSMGMTHDLEVAVAHGATVVRVGSAIFGARG
jgi:pyridoxal phosphate enzyme (YggS family)